MSTTDTFDRLVDNALDFFSDAVAQFATKPKFSLVQFCTAMELILKSRLLAEHWTLVLAKPDQADLSAFEKGEFLSVSTKDAVVRLDKVLGEALRSEEAECFLKVARDRNRMVHFFHSEEPREKERIAAEECRAWFYLHRLMTQRWRSYYERKADKIGSMHTAMGLCKEFLSAKYDAIRGDLPADGPVRVCPSCGHAAMVGQDVIGRLSSWDCRVCGYEEPLLVIECPTCGVRMECGTEYLNRGTVQCPTQGCAYECTTETLCDLLEELGGGKHGECPERGVCSECSETTVVSYAGKWLCASCLTLFDEVNECEYCGTSHAGLDMDESYLDGCPECEGRLSDLMKRKD